MSKLVTPEGRLSFPDLWKPRAFVDPEGKAGKAKYNATLLFPPGTDLGPLKAEATRALKDKFGSDATLKLCRGNNNPFHDCAEKPDLAGYEEGWSYIKFSSANPPKMVRRKAGQTVPISEEEGILFAGCWVKLSTSAYAYDYLGKGVAFGLFSVLLCKSGEPFGVSADPASEFADEEADYEEVEVGDDLVESDEPF